MRIIGTILASAVLLVQISAKICPSRVRTVDGWVDCRGHCLETNETYADYQSESETQTSWYCNTSKTYPCDPHTEVFCVEHDDTPVVRRYEISISAYTCPSDTRDLRSTISNLSGCPLENIHITNACRASSSVINSETYMLEFDFEWQIEYRNNYEFRECEGKLINGSLLDFHSERVTYEDIDTKIIVHNNIPYISSRHTLYNTNETTSKECAKESSYVSRPYLSAGPIGSARYLTQAFADDPTLSLDGVYNISMVEDRWFLKASGASLNKIVFFCEITKNMSMSTVESLLSRNEEEDDGNLILVITLSIVGFFTVAAITVHVLFTHRRRLKSQQYKKHIIQRVDLLNDYMGELSERAKAWKIDWKHISKPGTLIWSSKDGTSTVRRCVLNDKFDVAVKTFGENRRLGTRIDLVDSEISELVALSHHERLVWFIGCGREDDFIFVVTEFAEGGTLSDFLFGNEKKEKRRKKKKINIQTRLELLLDVHEAMCFLHHTKKMIHGNLRTSKILIMKDIKTNKLRAKLSDSGFERILRHTEKKASVCPVPSGGLELTSMSSKTPRRSHVVDERSLRFLSPELCELYLRDKSLESKITFQSEIYAFSIVMWETISCTRSWSKMSNFDIAARVSQGERPLLSGIEKKYLGEEFVLYMRACWSQKSSLRPDFTKSSRRRICNSSFCVESNTNKNGGDLGRKLFEMSKGVHSV